ncbi:MAG: hypothetical protein LBU16_06665 [Treponema sp.]|nr:hypothetical protein [Treponema sp.]
MKDRSVFTGIAGLFLATLLVLIGCPGPTGSGGGTSDSPVTISVIPGVTTPATGGTAAVTITETAQFTGTVSWSPQPAGGTFAANTVYTAIITLMAKAGRTFNGVTANFFTVPEATTTTSAANSGTVIAVFPSTAAAQANFAPAVNDATANDVATLGLVGTTAVSGAPAVATAEIAGGKIKITSASAGSVAITVSDAANHSAAIQVTVTASGSITIGAITKYVSVNPLLGAWAWREGDTEELLVFTDTIAYYAPYITKQLQNVDRVNEWIYLAVPEVNGGISKSYTYELNANKQLVLKNSYFTDNEDKPVDFAFTRIEGSAKTGIEDVWYSRGRTAEDPLHTLLVIRTDGTVYVSFGMANTNWWISSTAAEWVRASYELIGITSTGGTIRWTDGSDANNNYTIDEDELAVWGRGGKVYTKQNL